MDRDQWIVVDPRKTLTIMLVEYWEKLDWKAKSTTQLCLSYLVLLNVSREDIVKDLQVKLGNLYQSKSLVKKLFL